METIRVETEARPASYDVIIQAGALRRLGELVRAAAPAHRYVVIADSQVERHWGVTALAALEQAGLRADLLSFPQGEAHKTRETWSALTDRMLGLGVGRDSVVVALGGGVTGDVAGFVAATYMRGLPCVQVPTSLLAMIDAAVGGKTGVDAPAGKNLIGAFLQPRLVLIDPETLDTLPQAQLVNGLAEAVKHGAIADQSYFHWLGSESALETREARLRLIGDSVRIKAGFVAADVFENGPRAALNFGHTIGHALELASGFELAHGQAVSIGMVTEATLGERLGITVPGTARELAAVLRNCGLDSALPAGSAAAMTATLLDKKARGGKSRFVLLSGIGTVARPADGAWSFEADPALVAEVITDGQQA